MHKYRGGLARLRSVNPGGYTLVEVMIFLAVSSAIFISAVALVSGQQGKTQFQQSMRDLNSKIQNTISEVKAGVYTNANATCTVDTASSFDITVDNGTATEQGANEACLYLGKSLHLIQGDDKIYIYTVLGSRVYKPSAASSALAPATKFDDTSPQAILGGSVELTEEYELPYGANIISSKVTTVSGSSGVDAPMVGFYQSLENEVDNTANVDTDPDLEIVNGSQSIFARAYTGGVSSTPKDTSLSECIRRGTGCGRETITKWELCVKSETSNQEGLVTVTTTSSGVGTEMEIKDCSP